MAITVISLSVVAVFVLSNMVPMESPKADINSYLDNFLFCSTYLFVVFYSKFDNHI